MTIIRRHDLTRENWPKNDLPLLERHAVTAGERWIYSAGFNVQSDLVEAGRIDCELDDLNYLRRRGAKTVVLAHQGSYQDGTAKHLDFVADYLSSKIGETVKYVRSNIGHQAIDAANKMQCGDVWIFGNTRLHPGEENNDPSLARAFSDLGDFVALGGFSKAHRAHASNVGILSFRQGYLAKSVTQELDLLVSWARLEPRSYSVAVLGGKKPEKTTVGLSGFCERYDAVIPGGLVLNNILSAMGYYIGASPLGSDPATIKSAKAAISSPWCKKILLPTEVHAATLSNGQYHRVRKLPLGAPMGPQEAIVDFTLSHVALGALDRAARSNGRLIVAGTPTLFRQGFRVGSEPILRAAETMPGRAILLGGDTVSDLPFGGLKSTGGGSSLTYICKAYLPIEDALRRRTTALGVTT